MLWFTYMMTVYFLYIINIEYIPELNAEILFGDLRVKKLQQKPEEFCGSLAELWQP